MLVARKRGGFVTIGMISLNSSAFKTNYVLAVPTNAVLSYTNRSLIQIYKCSTMVLLWQQIFTIF